LPKDPPTPPRQDGTGGTYNYQLYGRSFWLGMALCDDQSAPNPGGATLAGPNIACKPDSDDNIFYASDPSANDYIGKHPGAAFLEMQFYPPGNVFFGCGVAHWCSALGIASLSVNQNTGQVNNAACQEAAGIMSANFAYITKNGVPVGPPSSLL